MYYKEDWEKAKKRFEALWQGEIIDRCCIAVTAPKKGGESFFLDRQKRVEERKTVREGMLMSAYMSDPARVLKEKTEIMEHTFYGGEAFPQIWMNFGPVGHAAYFDAPYTVGDSTTWFDPVVEDITKTSLKFNENNQILRWQKEAATVFSKEGKDKFIVSTPDNSGSLDALGALCKTEDLLIDMLENPDDVRRELNKIVNAWKYVNDTMYDITRSANFDGSSIGWLDIWAPGKFSQLQSDMSVMLSNNLFKEFVLPELKESAKNQAYSLYHLDGQDQLRHLDDILSVPEIKMIQWVSVAGQPGYMKFIPVFQKIQAAGRAVLINDVFPADVPKLLDLLRPERLLIMTKTNSQDEAQDLLKIVEKHDRFYR